MHLEPAIRNDLIELIAANFKTDEVNELGRLVLGCFDSNEAAGKRHHVSLSPRKSAGLLVEKCQSGETLASLMKLVVEVDNAVVRGRPVQVDGLEEFLGKLVRTGIQYDFKTLRVVKSCRDPHDLPNWGCLKDGREYDITVVSLDIVGNSAKVRKLGTRRMEKLYFTLWSFLREKLKSSTLPGTVSISRAVSDALPPGWPRSSASAGSSRRRISSARSGVWTPCSARSLAGAKNDSPEGEETMSAQGRIIP